jgi:hypothetical protein
MTGIVSTCLFIKTNRRRLQNYLPIVVAGTDKRHFIMHAPKIGTPPPKKMVSAIVFKAKMHARDYLYFAAL